MVLYAEIQKPSDLGSRVCENRGKRHNKINPQCLAGGYVGVGLIFSIPRIRAFLSSLEY